MEKDEKLTYILKELRKEWVALEDKPAEQIEKALKNAVKLSYPIDQSGNVFHDVSIAEYETKYKRNPPKEYKKLTSLQKLDLENDYKKKSVMIENFMRSFCCGMLKKRFDNDKLPDKVIDQIVRNLESKKYFSAMTIDMNPHISLMIQPLFSYWLEEKQENMKVAFNALCEKVSHKIIEYKIVDEWGYYFRGHEFTALSKWVSEFIDKVEYEMLQESKTAFEELKKKVNPKLYLLKTTEDGTALVFNEFGCLYLFPKRSTVPVFYSDHYVKEFLNIKEQCPAAFQDFNLEQWWAKPNMKRSRVQLLSL